jgi:hypothetical protein
MWSGASDVARYPMLDARSWILDVTIAECGSAFALGYGETSCGLQCGSGLSAANLFIGRWAFAVLAVLYSCLVIPSSLVIRASSFGQVSPLASAPITDVVVDLMS